ncbi:hypothetical protein FF011L_40250 [Roseimaritima multifibrata]|uniref:Uncharacterized protein n=1 Tax=Roseimaritima multifibrata TaxID=1930274 RepID=A0A517MK16_9BACT|nr:hypothetical protein [Roseimaritima multifibrata]QDS95232.1 hypothetical protein FF011L_40250 [Roseimaritima multifibrata]
MVAYHLWRVIYKFLRANAVDAARCHLLWRLANGFRRESAQAKRNTRSLSGECPTACTVRLRKIRGSLRMVSISDDESIDGTLGL